MFIVDRPTTCVSQAVVYTQALLEETSRTSRTVALSRKPKGQSVKRLDKWW
jgi:hypothetical protein